jgi:hypothetical protein
MKKTGYLLIFLCSTTYAQVSSFGNFKVAEQEIIFQKVFAEDSISAARLAEHYKTLDFISNLKETSTGVQFDMNDITVDYKKFQFSQVATPHIIQTGKYSGKVSIDVRDGRYRVTVQAIQMTGDIGYKRITAKENLTNYSTKNSATQLHPDWCKPNMLGLLDQAFSDKLQFPGKGKEDW